MAHLHTPRTLLLLLFVVAGCSGTQPKQVGEEDYFGQPPTSEDTSQDTSPVSSDVSSDPEETGGLSPDQKEQMKIALRRGGKKASNCSEVVPNSPTGEGQVKVTFDGTKGRATDVSVGPPFAGTPVETCIKKAFIGEYVMPFDGDLEVPYNVTLPPKKK